MLPDLAAQAERLLDELFAKFPVAEKPRILWKGLRVTAGIAYYKQNAIGLSKSILTDEARLRDTLTHEYAHLLAVHRTGPKAANHGIPWRTAMRDLGAEPKVHHNYEVERNAKHQEVGYRCMKCGATIRRSRRLPRKRQYVHSDCGGEVRLAYTRRVTPGRPDS
jgi:predicted SprT family Zn-dependent metalloprotease